MTLKFETVLIDTEIVLK